MAIYPGNPAVAFEQVQAATKTTSALTKITMGSHTGTHIDAPSHVDPTGEGTAAYDLDQLCGPCEVVDVTNVDRVILATDLPPTATPRVLIKTKNSALLVDEFDPDFIALSDTAAQALIKRGVQLVGIDGWSIKKKGVRDNVHKLLLDAGVVIVEGLYLHGVEARAYELICLPLSVNLDGAPVRAALRP
jgi:arylformamidase